MKKDKLRLLQVISLLKYSCISPAGEEGHLKILKKDLLIRAILFLQPIMSH